MTGSRRRSLQLPHTAPVGPQGSRRSRRITRVRLFWTGLLYLLLGSAMLVGLMQLPERLDAVLLLSTSIAKLIGGLQGVVTGLLQLLAVALVVLVALLALVLLVGGIVRLVRCLLPRSRRPRVS
ncbi:MAG: hypothetical protein AAFX65_06715 [Cyanobacteria bacterium J06638_7]